MKEIYPIGYFTRGFCIEDVDIYDVMDKLGELIDGYNELRVKVEGLLEAKEAKDVEQVDEV